MRKFKFNYFWNSYIDRNYSAAISLKKKLNNLDRKQKSVSFLSSEMQVQYY